MTDTHDFNDGNGPVPAHRHVNGGGWVANTASVDDTAYIGRDAHVFGHAIVRDHTRVFGHARVFGLAIVRGHAVVSRTPKVLTGFRHVATFTDHHVIVGCEMHPPSVWSSRGAAIIEKHGFSSDEATAWANIINAIAEAHGCCDKEDEE